MQESDVESTLANLRKSWPKWEPTTDELDRWRTFLVRCPQDRMVEAITMAWESSKSNRPWPADLREHLRNLCPLKTGGNADAGETDDCGDSGWYVECVENATWPGRVGRRVSLLFGKNANVPAVDALWRHAETMRQLHEGLYGGQWQTFRPVEAVA